MKQVFLIALLAGLVLPVAAAAGPLAGAVAAVQAFAASSALAGFVVRIGISLALSALARALQPKPDRPRQPGIKTQITTTGGANPQTFVLGAYCTAGNMIAPPYSAPNAGDVPNRFLTYVIDIADMPGTSLLRVIVNGEYVIDLAATNEFNFTQRGMLIDGNHHLYLNYYDGTQTAADPYMLATFSGGSRPWSADMIGTGVAYAVVNFRYNREVFSSLPGVRFEVRGHPLYNPRADSSVGGSGGQRWDDPATWAQTENPAVMIYNILRGITLPDGSVYGGGVAAEDLPLDVWFAAMNECDAQIPLAGGGTEPQFTAGLEVSVDEPPAGVIEELLKACSGEMMEMGGTFKIRVGAVGLPVYFLGDGDLVIDAGQSLEPYPGLEGVFNGIHATYPAPQALWELVDAPPIYDGALEAEDGGRRLIANVELPAVSRDLQVQRLMKFWLADERRFRRHTLTLAPEAAILEPLDAIAWTSEVNGYTAKIFEIAEIADDLQTCLQAVAIRERDAGDVNWQPTDARALSFPANAIAPFAPRTLAGFLATGATIIDGGALARRPGILLQWDADEVIDATGIQFEIEAKTPAELVAQGVTADVGKGSRLVSEGILPGETYRARARLVASVPTAWSAWQDVTAPDVRLDIVDLNPTIGTALDATQVLISEALVLRAKAGTAAAQLELVAAETLTGPASTARLSADDIILDGSTRTRHLTIDEALDINAQNGSFRLGKTSANDLLSDGIYLGRNGSPGSFGFNVGRRANGREEYIRHTAEGGLQLKNATFLLGAGLSTEAVYNGDVNHTVSAGATRISIDLQAGGGGGGSNSQDNQAGAAGGVTTAQIRDGLTVVQTITATGGAGGLAIAGGVREGGKAILNPRGNGGDGAPGVQQGAEGDVFTPGRGGNAGQFVAAANIDVSGLSSPNVIFNVGGGGAGAGSSAGGGANGAGGQARIEEFGATEIGAGPVARRPSAEGAFLVTSGVAGTFPVLSPTRGIWVCTFCPAGWEVSIFSSSTIEVGDGKTISFPTEATPQWTAAHTETRSVRYKFFPMG